MSDGISKKIGEEALNNKTNGTTQNKGLISKTENS